MENILRFSRPTENQKETIPESIAAQWGPGYFYIIFWKWVALIFYRDIDCQSIVSVSGLSILWSSELAAFRESFTCPSVSGWISFFSTPGNITHSAGLLWNIRPHESRTSVEPSLAFDVLHYQFPLFGYRKPSDRAFLRFSQNGSCFTLLAAFLCMVFDLLQFKASSSMMIRNI